MFYSQFILAKKGPLGTIWIAAHLERKLRKNQVADTDIGVSVDSILCPEVPIALRLSSHLLLGVVRIYSRKVNYLFDDCSDALLKVKQAFRSTAVDLPPEQSKAPYHSITLPETFDLDDFELPDNEIFHGNDRHVSTREQITLQDTMAGATFTTSQFGPDERFGDGDASQIGLDLDEDLFLEKGVAAGTSDILNSRDADPSPAKDATHYKDGEHSEKASDLPLASSSNYFSIQAPSTPGLTEEPNLPSAEEAVISDYHMDEDQNIPESAAKEASGTESIQVEPSSVQNLEFNSNGNSRHLDEEDNELVKPESSIVPDEAAVDTTSHGDAHSLKSSEQIEAISDVNNLQNKLDYSSLQNDGNVAADIQSFREYREHDEAGLNRLEDVIFTEVNDQDTCPDNLKADLNGSHLPDSDIRSDNNNSLVGQEVIIAEASETFIASNGDQCQKSDQPCQNLENSETFEYNKSEKLSVSDTPVLKPCNSHSHNTVGVEKLPDASKLSGTEDELCPLGLSSRQDGTNFAEISTDIHDLTMPIPNADLITQESADATTSSLDRPLGNGNLEEDHLVRENNSKVTDFSAPEKLLSMPNLSAGLPDSIVIEATPYTEMVARDGDNIEVLARDNTSFENLLSGKKRSYTESTLTIQSLNSAASSGAAQSKQSVELVPEDDDLLSSILGGRSTTFKLKPTPPAADSLPAKRQRTSVRSSAQKRKVVIDDSMVLHGDMIREQLTNTEDIRRVRKKAPCTRLEVWVLQKQFLEDEVFSEPIFTGYLPEFRCLYSQARDLSAIRIVQDDGNKGIKDTNTSKLMHAEGGETETPVRYESMFGVDALQKELETFDNEVAKQMSKHDLPAEKADMENIDQAGCEGNQLVASTAELTTPVSHVPEVSCNLTDNNKVDTPQLHDTTGVVVPADIDESHQLINQDYHIELTKEGACTMEEVSGSGGQYHEVDANVDRELDDKSLLDEREGDVEADTIVFMEGNGELDSKSLLDKKEDDVEVDTIVFMEVDGELDGKSLLDEREDAEADTIEFMENIPSTYSVNLEGRASPTLDRNMEECQLSDPRFENEEKVIGSDARHGDNFPMSSNIPEEDVTLEPSGIILETDLFSEDNKLDEKEDSLCLETEPTLETDPVFINPEDQQSDFGTEFIEHDTDFLNVDDDDAAEDYEDDMGNPEEKRMLDNTGWSSRTRAVANYLQGLFEKDTRHAKVVIPLESLLVGKTRKEASRMFFETLVLKTKDYIDAEQADSFCEIKIKAKGKLMKSEF